MSEAEAFDRILASLREAALDPARWPTASALIDEALGTHGNNLVVGGGSAAEDIRIFLIWQFFRGQRHREWEREYYEVYYPLDERPPRIRDAPDSRLLHTTDLFTEEELKTSATYNEALADSHAQDGIHVRLDGPNASHIVWGVNDPVDANGWSSRQVDTIRRLLPHIRQSVRVQQALAGADALGASLAQLLEATGLGIVQLDRRGQIVARNDPARDLLRTGDGLFDEGGFLYARRRQDNDKLQGLLTRAVPPFGVEGVGGAMMVTRESALAPLVLHVNPVGRQETAWPVWSVAALVLVVEPSSQPRIDPAVAAATLGLTGMESSVAVLLAEGMSVRQIAAATGRKESTIRSHVKHVFAKHGLSRQADLVRLVLSLAGTPESRR